MFAIGNVETLVGHAYGDENVTILATTELANSLLRFGAFIGDRKRHFDALVPTLDLLADLACHLLGCANDNRTRRVDGFPVLDPMLHATPEKVRAELRAFQERLDDL